VDKKERFLAAIKQNEGFIYKLASAYTNNVHDRQDLVQEILYQLWKSFETFNEKSKIGTWIYRVALNVSIYQLKKTKQKISTIPINEHIEDYHEDRNNENEEKWKVFRQQIEDLNLLDKGIILLYLDNKSHDEIADITGISKTNVGTKLMRIKNKLKQKINKNL
jgi:RNA polymerase sigma-70 factor (ECF subfamily)